tara:strand:+ start:48 stop:449 length:402 start_codon:yes stop_codon:yes gene_type:complete
LIDAVILARTVGVIECSSNMVNMKRIEKVKVNIKMKMKMKTTTTTTTTKVMNTKDVVFIGAVNVGSNHVSINLILKLGCRSTLIKLRYGHLNVYHVNVVAVVVVVMAIDQYHMKNQVICNMKMIHLLHTKEDW